MQQKRSPGRDFLRFFLHFWWWNILLSVFIAVSPALTFYLYYTNEGPGDPSGDFTRVMAIIALGQLLLLFIFMILKFAKRQWLPGAALIIHLIIFAMVLYIFVGYSIIVNGYVPV